MKKQTTTNAIVTEHEQHISDIHHDVKNVLASIKAYTHLVKLKIAKKQYNDVEEYLSAIDNQIEKLVDMTTDLVTIRAKQVKK